MSDSFCGFPKLVKDMSELEMLMKIPLEYFFYNTYRKLLVVKNFFVELSHIKMI
jgi:hypothetical protein